LYELSTRIFNDNWGYTGISWDEFRALYDGLDRLIDPDLVLFALDAKQTPIGFVFALPDLAQAVRSLRGESHLLAKLRFWRERRQTTNTVIVKTLGVLPEARQTGIGSVLVALAHQAAQTKGYTKAIHALMSEENASRKISEKSGAALREYAVYEVRP
jgi:GNAT superfamily N-acetyltransferase